MEVFIEILSLLGIFSIAFVFGKLVSKLRLPAILGWLIAGIIFGPYLVKLVTSATLDATWYKVTMKFVECFCGVMIGKEIIFKEIKKSGKQIIGITFIQSIMTFLVVSAVFAIVFYITDVPLYLSLVFGGIALATAPAPALSIVNEYKTKGPVTNTLIPLAAIDDIIGVIIFFSVMTVISTVFNTTGQSPWMIVLMVILPIIIGIIIGLISALIFKFLKNKWLKLSCFVLFLVLNVITGLLFDKYVFQSFSLNYMLIGMSFTCTLVNLIKKEDLEEMFKLYSPLINISLLMCIVNLGMPLDYKLIAGAGLYTFIYIFSRALGKISGASIGGLITRAEPTVTKFLGFTILPHSGVSLVFTGIATSTLTLIDPNLANIVSGTICAAAIINELIAVIIARFAFKWAKEMPENYLNKEEEITEKV